MPSLWNSWFSKPTNNGYNMSPQNNNAYQNNMMGNNRQRQNALGQNVRGANALGQPPMRQNNSGMGGVFQHRNNQNTGQVGRGQMPQNMGQLGQPGQNQMPPSMGQMGQNQMPPSMGQPGQNQMPPSMGQMGQNLMPPNMGQMQPNQTPQQNGTLPGVGHGGVERPFNKPLPDGVTLHPITEENMRQLHTIGAVPSVPSDLPKTDAGETFVFQQKTNDSEQAVVPQQANKGENLVAPQKTKESSHSQRLQDFIQNERNGGIFYKHLSAVAPQASYRNMLNQMSERCNKHKNAYHSMHKEMGGSDFLPKEATINNKVRFQAGVRLAIEEESKMLRELSDFYDETENSTVTKKLSSQMARKVSDLSLLQLMSTDK